MKYIKKGDSPAKFEQWKIDFKDRTGREPVYLDLKGSIKRDLKETLLKEQGYICCYCMCRIAAYDSHIEHFIARSEAKDQPYSVVVQDAELGYENLLLSCEGEEGDGKHCGRFKDNAVHEMLLSPTVPSVESDFQYTANGEINGLSPEAMTSVRVLNLSSYDLNRHRRTAIFMSGLFEPDADYDFLIEKFRVPEDGMYAPFCQAILYVLETLKRGEIE